MKSRIILEDTGGPWSYEEMRINLGKWEKLKKKEKDEIAYRRKEVAGESGGALSPADL